MLRARRAPWVYYHNIVGVKPDAGIWNQFSSKTSDGVVELKSAHMDDVVSEIVVESGHQDIHRKPRAILEVRQILLGHLEQVRVDNPNFGQPQNLPMVKRKALPKELPTVVPASANIGPPDYIRPTSRTSGDPRRK